MEYFKREVGGYTTNLNPVSAYMEQAVKCVSSYKNISRDAALEVVRGVINANKPRDPLVTFRVRGDNGDRSLDKCKLTEYIKKTVRDKDILVPSFTVYDHPSKKRSLHADFLKINIDKRKIHKRIAAVAYQNGDMDTYTNNNVLQKKMKVFNNSLSGAYASKSTCLYNPSQHYTLTSMTRSIASIGNAVTETVVAGNKGLYSPDSVMNYITAIITTVCLKTVTAAMVRYKLTYPSVDAVVSMLKYSTVRYWVNVDKYDIIKRYVERLTDTERAAVMYVNDLFHMRKHNEVLVRSLVGDMAKRVTHANINPLTILKRDVEGINNLVHHICMEDIKGMNVVYDDLVKDNPDLLMVLGATADNVYNVLDTYRLLFKAFFITDILPIDIANIKDSYRDVIVLSDTDSTCGSYDNWTHWYFGFNKFTSEAVALSAVVMTINTQVMDHNIKVFAKNMNIEDSSVELLKMKNEYFWSVFITANVSKHYFANTHIQEGVVYSKPKLELKGVHLIASAGNQDIVAAARIAMDEQLIAVEQGVKLDPKKLLTKVADLERSILSAIDNGETNMFKLEKVKDAEAYKLDDKSKTNYFHHMLWDEVFADKYGISGDPTYMVVKVSTTLKSKRLMALYLDKIEDDGIKEKLTNTLNKYGKDALGTFKVPHAVVAGKGIPKEIILAVDRQRTVLDNMNIFYLQLETLGLYRKPNLLFSDTGY